MEGTVPKQLRHKMAELFQGTTRLCLTDMYNVVEKSKRYRKYIATGEYKNLKKKIHSCYDIRDGSQGNTKADGFIYTQNEVRKSS